MGLLSRLTTLAQADAHGVVDALEDKALVLRQHLREAGAELGRKRCRHEALAAEDTDLEAETARLHERQEALEADIALALGQDQEELARFAIKKLLPLRHRCTAIGHRREAIERQRADLGAQLARQEAEYEQLEQRVRGYLAQCEQDPTAGGLSFAQPVVADEDIELELLRRRRTMAEGGA